MTPRSFAEPQGDSVQELSSESTEPQKAAMILQVCIQDQESANLVLRLPQRTIVS
jgi:hypothetical protein